MTFTSAHRGFYYSKITIYRIKETKLQEGKWAICSKQYTVKKKIKQAKSNLKK